jgi:hypothetical protein
LQCRSKLIGVVLELRVRLTADVVPQGFFVCGHRRPVLAAHPREGEALGRNLDPAAQRRRPSSSRYETSVPFLPKVCLDGITSGHVRGLSKTWPPGVCKRRNRSSGSISTVPAVPAGTPLRAPWTGVSGGASRTGPRFGIRGDRARREQVALKVATELIEDRHHSMALAIQPLAALPMRLIQRDDVVRAVAMISMDPYDAKAAGVDRLME